MAIEPSRTFEYHRYATERPRIVGVEILISVKQNVCSKSHALKKFKYFVKWLCAIKTSG